MNIEQVFVESNNGAIENEAFYKAWLGFQKRGVKCTLFQSTELENETLPLTRSTLVVGGLRTVEAAIKQIGVRMPVANNLPNELAKYFGRTIRTTTLGNVRDEWKLGDADSCFLKPLDQNKLFPAIALFDRDDLATLDSHADDVRVVVSEYVMFESEWRVFVVEKEIIGMSHYQGDCFRYPDALTIKTAIKKFHSAPAGYGIDFGVLSNGRTVLVEANDGYSLGSYGLNSVDYAGLLEARWIELAS